MILTEKQTDNVNKLITHYRNGPGVKGWGYDECLAGVALHLGIVENMYRSYDLAEAIGVSEGTANRLISGPIHYQWGAYANTDAFRRDWVVRLLQAIINNTEVGWEATLPPTAASAQGATYAPQ